MHRHRRGPSRFGGRPRACEICEAATGTRCGSNIASWTHSTPLIGWYDSGCSRIDLGIIMLMAENHRSGLVWSTFMKNPKQLQRCKKSVFIPLSRGPAPPPELAPQRGVFLRARTH